MEDNYVGGVARKSPKRRPGRARCASDSMYVQNLPKSGKTPEDVLAYCHLSEADIVAKAKAMVGIVVLIHKKAIARAQDRES